MTEKTKKLFDKLEKFQMDFDSDFNSDFDNFKSDSLDYDNILASPIKMKDRINDINDKMKQLDLKLGSYIPNLSTTSHKSSRNNSTDNGNTYNGNTDNGNTDIDALKSELKGLGITVEPLYIDSYNYDDLDDDDDDEDYLDLYSQLSSSRNTSIQTITRDSSIHSLSIKPKEFLKDFNKDLKILNQGIENNSLILDCMNDMLLQENNEIVNCLNDFINDITNSVANNTISIKFDNFLTGKRRI